jgi:hypothetical protein
MLVDMVGEAGGLELAVLVATLAMLADSRFVGDGCVALTEVHDELCLS